MADPKQRRTLLIFDLDGTLYRTDSSFVPTMRRVYGEFRVPYPGDGAILAMVGETFGTFLDWLSPQGFAVDEAQLSARISELELISIRERGVLFDGVAETLRTLSEREHVLTLCTNGDRRYAEAVLGRCGILGMFQQLQTLDGVPSTKAQRIAELRDLYPGHRAFVVGDRYHDVEAGRATGCTVVGAAYGYARNGELDGADHIIRSFSDLLALIEPRRARMNDRAPADSRAGQGREPHA
ncbi:MAG: HAD family hydrolase [Candidatus Bipolaricaulota bacterium]|nr:HAD family hydrolase [Candidatus Bipolaricaulota bacterium]